MKREFGVGYEWPSDKEGERAIQAVKDSMPSKAQTRYNQRDIKKRRERIKNEKVHKGANQ
tara:strand:+ start:965 stop:1144 length:180 start_codon:yes stop_codon:yes gene_type:complete